MSIKRTPAKNHAAGFTLVEVLVALAVFALTSILAAQGLSFSISSWRDADSRAATLQRNLAAYDLLREQLLVALPYYGSPNDPAQVSLFRGDSNGFRVATRGPVALGLRGIVWFGISSAQSATGTAMAVSWSEDPEGKTPLSLTSGERHVQLLERLEKLEFGYFGPPSENSRAQWMSSWSRQDRPPDLVRVIAEFHDATGSDWPDLVVHIRTDMSSRCHFDQVSRICRLS